MIKELLNSLLEKAKTSENSKTPVNIGETEVLAYENSFHKDDNNIFFTGIVSGSKYFFVVTPKNANELLNNFEGNLLETDEDIVVKQCPQVHSNVVAIQKIFDFTVPKLLGYKNSFGFGDRIGLANPAHLRSLTAEDDFAPILAQQSIRELSRTVRKAENVMDAAVWAVMQEGWTSGFGSDADHLKTENDVDTMVAAGFTMFTFDPSDHWDQT